MADFGKLNFSVSFNPTSAFPVDARYHFTTLAAAQAAAQGAVEVGSSEGTYFFGETVVVQTATDATLYVIQPDKTLKALGSSSDVSTLRVAIEAAQKDATQALKDAAAAKAAADAKVASVSVGDGITKTGTDTAPVLDVKVDPASDNALTKSATGLKVVVPEGKDYTVTVDTTNTTSGAAKSYTLKQLGKNIATIDIPKDMVVSEGIVKKINTKPDDFPEGQQFTAGTYIVLTIANKASNKLYINVSDLLDDKTVEGVTGADITVTTDSSEGPVKITATINEKAVQTKHIADSAVTTVKINSKAVTTDKIADGAVDTLQIKDNAVTTGKILDSAVTTAKINAKAVTSAKIADEAVGETQIADEAVTIGKIATAAKTTAIDKAAASDSTIPTTKAVTDYVDTALDAKANAADVYTKTEVDTKLAKKANSSTTLAGYGITDAYTSTEVDTELAKKADKTYVDTELAKKANVATTLSGYGITDAYTKSQVDAKVSSVYKYKGTVATVSDLPAADLTVGDVYNVEAAGTISSGESAVKVNAGDNVVWTGTAWDVLAGTVDLTDYYTKTQVDTELAKKANSATTLAGYGIIDAYTKTEADNKLSVKLEDAPSDGKQYARNNGAWSEVVIPEVVTPTLDAVLTAGNSSSKDILITNGAEGGRSLQLSTLEVLSTVGTTTGAFSAAGLSFSDTSTSTKSFAINPSAKSVEGSDAMKTAFNSFLQNTISGSTAKIDGTTLTKSHVGLSNVTNESKETMFTNPTFTGTVTVPTPTVDTAAATKKYVDDTVGAVKPTLDDVLTNGNTTTKSAIFKTATSKIEVDSEKIALSSISGDIDTKQFELSYSSTPGVTGSEAMRTAFVNWLNTGTIYRYSA